MVILCNGSQYDINHFLKVWAYARTIGEQEKYRKQAGKFMQDVFRTKTWISLLEKIYMGDNREDAV